MSVAAINTPEPEERLGVNSLTAAESAMAERKASQSITTLGNDAYPQVGLIGALGWVLARRGDPRLTYDAYMSSHRVDQIAKELGLSDDDEDPDEEDDTTPETDDDD